MCYLKEYKGYTIRMMTSPDFLWSETSGQFTSDEKLVSVFTDTFSAFQALNIHDLKAIAYVCAM